MSGNDTATTAAQNLVIAFNSLNKTQQYLGGQLTSDAYPAAAKSRVFQGRCRAVAVNILVDGGELKLYDSSEPTITPATSLKFALDNSALVGRHEVGAEFKNGIVIELTGTTEAVVTYSVF